MSVDIRGFFSKIFTKAGIEVVAMISIIMAFSVNNTLPENVLHFNWLEWILFIILLISGAKVIISMMLGIVDMVALRIAEIQHKVRNYAGEIITKEEINVMDLGKEFINVVGDAVPTKEAKAIKEAKKLLERLEEKEVET